MWYHMRQIRMQMAGSNHVDVTVLYIGIYFNLVAESQSRNLRACPHMNLSSAARELGQIHGSCTFARTQYACMPCGVFDAPSVALYALQVCFLLQWSSPSVWVGWSDAQTICWVPWKAHVVWIVCPAPVFSCRIVRIKRHYSTRAHCPESHLVRPQALQNNTV